MIIDFQNTLAFLIFGVAVGGLYFWLLWLTVRSMSISPDPWRASITGIGVRVVLLFSSFTALVLFKADAIDIIVWLVGFLALKFIVVGRMKIPNSLSLKPRG